MLMFQDGAHEPKLSFQILEQNLVAFVISLLWRMTLSCEVPVMFSPRAHRYSYINRPFNGVALITGGGCGMKARLVILIKLIVIIIIHGN